MFIIFSVLHVSQNFLETEGKTRQQFQQFPAKDQQGHSEQRCGGEIYRHLKTKPSFKGCAVNTCHGAKIDMEYPDSVPLPLHCPTSISLEC